MEQNEPDTIVYTTVWFHLRKPKKAKQIDVVEAGLTGVEQGGAPGTLAKPHVFIGVSVARVPSHVKLPCAMHVRRMHFRWHVSYTSQNWLHQTQKTLYPRPIVLLQAHKNVFISPKIRGESEYNPTWMISFLSQQGHKIQYSVFL